MAAVAMLAASFALAGQAGADPVPSGSISPDVWDPADSRWENGHPSGLAEGEVAPFVAELSQGSSAATATGTWDVAVCLDYFTGGEYHFLDFADWDTDHVPATFPDGSSVASYAETTNGVVSIFSSAGTVSIDSVSAVYVATSSSADTALCVDVSYSYDGTSEIYLALGGYISKPGDTAAYDSTGAGFALPTSGVVEDAASGNGTFKIRLETSGADKTINFSGSAIEPAAGTMTLTKTWENGRPADWVTLGLASDASASSESVDTVGGTAGTAEIAITAGDTVTVRETFGLGDPDNYNISLECNDVAYVPVRDGAELSVGIEITEDMAAADMTCVYTNSRKAGTLYLSKVWANALDGDAVALTIDGETFDQVDTYFPSPAAPATAAVYAGETVDLTESMFAANRGTYVNTDLQCSSGALTYTEGSFQASLAITADDIGVAPIVCEFTNTLKAVELVVEKEWVGGPNGVTVNLTAGDETGGRINTSVDSPNAAENNTATVYVGEQISVSEDFADGAEADNWTTTVACTVGGTVGTVNGVRDAEFTVPDVEGPIVCTFTNSVNTAAVVLQKVWVNANSGDTAQLELTSQSSGAAGAVSTAPEAPDMANTTTLAFPVTETIGIAEQLSDGDTYDTEVSCEGATNPLTDVAGDNRGASLELHPDDAGNEIVCTFTNTRPGTDLTFVKEWVGGVPGDSARLEATSGTDSDSGTAVAPGPERANPTIVVGAGDTVSLAESFGANQAAYDVTGFECVYSDDTGVHDLATGWSGDPADLDVRFGITPQAARGDDITCTVTNTAQRGTIVIVKNIEGGSDGTFEFSGDWPSTGSTSDPAGLDPANFTITTTDGSGDVVFEDVIVPADGEPFSIAELATTAGFDGTSVTCSGDADGDTSGPDEGTDLPLTGTIDLDAGETVTCTFTNTEQSRLVIVKDAQPDDPQDFEFTPSFADPFSLDDDADPTLPNTWVSDLVSAGTEISVTEGAVAGWLVDIEASRCSGPGLGDADWAFGDDSTVNVTMPVGATVTCTFVNIAQPAQIELVKLVENDDGTGAAQATDWELWLGDQMAATELWEDGDVPAGADSAASGVVEVPAGTWHLLETAAADAPAELLRPYQLTSIECVDMAGAPIPIIDGSITVGHGQLLRCTFVNDDADLTVTKIGLGSEEGVGWSDEDLSGGISAGDLVGFMVTGTNTGDVELANVVLTDPQLTADEFDCGTLVPGEFCEWGPLWLELTQEDVDAGQVANAAFGTSDQDDDDDEETVEYEPEPDMESVKTFTGCNPQVACEDGVQVGDVVTWDITVTNTGPVTLVDVVVEDELTGNVDDQALTCAIALAPASSCTVSVEYETTLADLEAGDAIPNVAFVTATPEPGGPPIEQEPPAEAPIRPEPGLELAKSVTPQVIDDADVGDEVTFTFEVTNVGNITLQDIAVVDDMINGEITCEATELDPGESTTCSAPYELTAEDIAAGQVNNVAITTGSSPRWPDPVESPPDDATVVFTDNPVVIFFTPPPAPTPTPEPDEVLEIQELAVTGANSRQLAAAALTMIIAGLSFVFGGYRRRDGQD